MKYYGFYEYNHNMHDTDNILCNILIIEDSERETS